MDNFCIYCVYHRDNIPDEYNLYESDHFKLFNDDDLTLQKDNINYLHNYLGQLTAYYYFWKNNLKSDIIGICHYSKHLKFIDYKRLKTFGIDIYAGSYIDSYELLYEKFIKNYNFVSTSLMLYLLNKYNINIFDYLKNHQKIFYSWHRIYVFKWDVFCDVCDFIFGFLEFMLPNGLWEDTKNIDMLSRLCNHPLEEDELYSDKAWFERNIDIYFEFIMGLYIGIYLTEKYHNKYYTKCSDIHNDKLFISLNDCIDNIDILKKWIKQNMKTGVSNYIIKSNLDKEYILNDIYNGLDKRTLNDDVYKLIVCNTDEEFNSILQEFESNNYNNINLNLNERIHCDSSLEFYKGNYYIEKYINK